jgi:hypothetical protein
MIAGVVETVVVANLGGAEATGCGKMPEVETERPALLGAFSQQGRGVGRGGDNAVGAAKLSAGVVETMVVAELSRAQEAGYRKRSKC